MHKLPIPQILPTLHNSLLTLRRMEDCDATDLLEIYGDHRVMRYTGENPFPNIDTVSVMLASVRKLLAEGVSLEWAIILRGTKDVIGTCGLYNFNGGARSAEVGCLLKRKAWGLGYMAKALLLVTTFAAQELKLKLLLADVDPKNKRAQRLFARLGFTPTETGYLSMYLEADQN